MEDIGKALLAKSDQIIERWVEEVRCDLDMENVRGLTYQAIHNDLPAVLEAIATLLTPALKDQSEELEDNALEHGAVRSQQNFDTAEVVREYRILRNVILAALAPELSTGTVQEVLAAVISIDTTLDEAVLASLERYVEQRLASLQQIQQQLQLTNQELARLVQNQKDSISHLAHELKTPLNAILGFSALLLRRQQQQLAQPPKASLEVQHIERVIANGQQLLRLVNNALEVSRRQIGQSELVIETASPQTIIQTVMDALEVTIGDKPIRLIKVCDRAPKQVQSDALRLQQIITNLLSNAIRYTEAGTVGVDCYTVDETHWVVAVSDTGKGISPEEQPKIFQPHFRVGDAEDYLPESSGLGLTIVDRLVKLLQGRIEVVSELGKGSTFTVVFPLQLQAPLEQ